MHILIQARSGRWMLQELEASFCTLQSESVVVLSVTDRIHQSAVDELDQHQELIRNRETVYINDFDCSVTSSFFEKSFLEVPEKDSPNLGKTFSDMFIDKFEKA